MVGTSIIFGAFAKALGISPWVFKAPLIVGKAAATGGLSLFVDVPAEIGSAIADVGAQKVFEAVSENPEFLNNLKEVGENAVSNFSDAGNDQAAQALARVTLREDLGLLVKDNT